MSQTQVIFSSPSTKDYRITITGCSTKAAQKQTQVFCHNYTRESVLETVINFGLGRPIRNSVPAQKEKKRYIIFSSHAHYGRNYGQKLCRLQEEKRGCNNSFLSGGWSGPKKYGELSKWKPNSQAVGAAFRFTIATERLTRIEKTRVAMSCIWKYRK